MPIFDDDLVTEDRLRRRARSGTLAWSGSPVAESAPRFPSFELDAPAPTVPLQTVREPIETELEAPPARRSNAFVFAFVSLVLVGGATAGAILLGGSHRTAQAPSAPSPDAVSTPHLTNAEVPTEPSPPPSDDPSRPSLVSNVPTRPSLVTAASTASPPPTSMPSTSVHALPTASPPASSAPVQALSTPPSVTRPTGRKRPTRASADMVDERRAAEKSTSAQSRALPDLDRAAAKAAVVPPGNDATPASAPEAVPAESSASSSATESTVAPAPSDVLPELKLHR